MLHTLQDFYAHSNYVELLLWELARRKELDDEIVAAFARSERPFALAPGDPFHCPLPRPPGQSPTSNAIMWYGNDPATTPLVSSVFDTKDTAYSLLSIYANHLQRPGQAATASEEIDFVLSILDVSGTPIAVDARIGPS